MRVNPDYVEKVTVPIGMHDAAVAFHRRLPSEVAPPIFFGPSRQFGVQNVLLMADIDNPIKAFKVRGGFSAVLGDGTELQGDVVVASSGNFGRGVSYSARSVGRIAHVFMAESTPASTVSSIEELGGVAHLVGASYDEAKVHAINFAHVNGCKFLDGVSDHVYRGNYGIGLELLERLAHEKLISTGKRVAVVLPVGIGSLLVPLKFGLQGQGIDLIAVEPAGFSKFAEKFETLPCGVGETVAKGCAVLRFPDFSESLALVSPNYYTVMDDDAILAGMADIYRYTGILVEGAGAIAWAALMSHRSFFSKYDAVAVIVTGKNCSPDIAGRVMSRVTAGQMDAG